MALALTIVLFRGSPLIGAVRIIGRCIGGASWAHAGLALAGGLGYLEGTLMTGEGKCGHLSKRGVVVMFTDYAPLRCPIQVKRRGVFGVPGQPSPEHRQIDEILGRWTRLSEVGALFLKEKGRRTIKFR